MNISNYIFTNTSFHRLLTTQSVLSPEMNEVQVVVYFTRLLLSVSCDILIFDSLLLTCTLYTILINILINMKN